MPDDSPDVPDDQAPEDTEVTCAGGIILPAPGAADGTPSHQE